MTRVTRLFLLAGMHHRVAPLTRDGEQMKRQQPTGQSLKPRKTEGAREIPMDVTVSGKVAELLSTQFEHGGKRMQRFSAFNVDST